MKNIRCNRKVLDSNGKGYASVIFIGDVHIGSPQCDEERFKRMLAYCEENPVYVYLMGDLLECSTRHSVGAGVYEQFENPQSQYERLVEMLSPIARQGKILGSLSGNHEGRIYKETGVDLAKQVCRELDIPYLGEAGWNLWRVGQVNYRIYTLHGASAARYSYTKLKSLVDISHSFDCDLIAQGHVHELAATSQLVQFVDLRSKTVKERKKWVMLTGHYLSYDGGYAQAKGLPISKLGSPKVKFFGEHRDIHISW